MTAKNKILIKAVLLLFVIISVVNIVITQVKYSRDKAVLDAAKAQEADLTQRVETLREKVENGSNDRMIEEALRERGYIKSGEKEYIDIAGN